MRGRDARATEKSAINPQNGHVILKNAINEAAFATGLLVGPGVTEKNLSPRIYADKQGLGMSIQEMDKMDEGAKISGDF
ncbi:MAG TPA: hypothetical protein PKD58_03200 [Candidatus Sumerlaeota bacterium]|nr:hypothetical protein [Candidatus Sumerlaeota bacterium]